MATIDFGIDWENTIMPNVFPGEWYNGDTFLQARSPKVATIDFYTAFWPKSGHYSLYTGLFARLGTPPPS